MRQPAAEQRDVLAGGRPRVRSNYCRFIASPSPILYFKEAPSLLAHSAALFLKRPRDCTAGRPRLRGRRADRRDGAVRRPGEARGQHGRGRAAGAGLPWVYLSTPYAPPSRHAVQMCQNTAMKHANMAYILPVSTMYDILRAWHVRATPWKLFGALYCHSERFCPIGRCAAPSRALHAAGASWGVDARRIVFRYESHSTILASLSNIRGHPP